jgi:hypothetical protein
LSKSTTKIIDGLHFPAEATDFHCHLYLFKYAPVLQANPDTAVKDGEKVFYSGTGRYSHARAMAEILWPKAFEWHKWSEQSFRSASSDNKWLALTGCGASGKSTAIGAYSLLWWMAAPHESAVLIASKTIESSKRRIWGEVSRLYSEFSRRVGGFKEAVSGTSPRPYISPIKEDGKRDEKHGLYVTALHGKDLDKEIGYIKGFHPRRILVVADELDSLEEGGQALIDTFIGNLATGADEAKMIALGNDPSPLNSLGELMEREPGRLVGLEDKEWVSAKGVECIRYDAFDSPNLTDNNKWTGNSSTGRY